LLSSDIGTTVERKLAQSNVRADILIKGRHSAEESGTDAFLEAVRPTMVVQVVNERPSDRYLEPAGRDRLRSRGLRWYRTDETGAVTIRLTKFGYSLHTWRDE
jgi:competence protein ComEC